MMANVQLTANFANLNTWAGRLFELPTGAIPTALSATSATILFPATGTEFPNYRIVMTGTGFEYDGGTPIGGVLSSVSILNAANQLVIRFTGLNTNPFTNDFAGFAHSLIGSEGSEGPGPNTEAAWSQLMAGNDVITGTTGNDRRGFAGMDAGNDVYNMAAGDDFVNGGMGDDTINGGDGYDVLSFEDTAFTGGVPAFRGVNVNLQTNVVLDAWGGTDSISGIERVDGSRFKDVFLGNAERNDFNGLRGADSIDGGFASYDTNSQRTGDHRDTVYYDSDYWKGGNRGIIVDLETGFAQGSIRGVIRDGFGNLDTVRDIERVVGTRYNDVFVGSRENNVFSGGEGVDSYSGEAGFDRVHFDRWFMDGSGPTSGVSIDMTLASGQVLNDGFGNSETMTGIEQVRGTGRADTVIGTAGNEAFSMAAGADTITGGGGVDSFEWWDATDMAGADRILDFTADGPGADVLYFSVESFTGMTGTLTLVNGTAATAAGVGTFIFNAVNDTLYWDRDGLGGAAARGIARLDNVDALTAGNFFLDL